MIIICLGNPGSGKTATVVREMALRTTGRLTYSNIKTKGIKNNNLIDPSMIIQKNMVSTKKKRDGSEEPVYEYKLNTEFWKKIKEPIDVILDEAHAIINARRAMNKVNIIVTDWLALIRRVLGQSDSGYGRLVLISQLHNRIDIIAREMATQVRFHRCHYVKSCKKCGVSWQENSDIPEPMWQCPKCASFGIKKDSHVIEVWHFPNMTAYIGWKEYGMNTYHKHYLVHDIENYFPLYNTLQWNNLFSEYY